MLGEEATQLYRCTSFLSKERQERTDLKEHWQLQPSIPLEAPWPPTAQRRSARQLVGGFDQRYQTFFKSIMAYLIVVSRPFFVIYDFNLETVGGHNFLPDVLS